MQKCAFIGKWDMEEAELRRVPFEVLSYTPDLFAVLGLRQPPRHELLVRRKGHRRLLRGLGDQLPDVSRLHHRPAGRTHGHPVPVPQRYRLRPGSSALCLIQH